ncbi:hypothetical protein KR018_006904 [Drosophila ironensis]|nr:hypothetical protein KR018_006904 [Drosophila ironensis]
MFFLRALTLCLAVGAAFGSEPVSTFQVTMETTLAELMLSSPFFRGAEPFNLDCVDYYVPELKVHADKYDADVLVCTNNYNTAYEKIDGSYTLTRTALFDNLRGACNALTACDDSTTNAGAFQCLAKTASDAAELLWLAL